MAEPRVPKAKGGAPIVKVGHTGVKAFGHDEKIQHVNPAPYEQTT